MYRPLIVLLTLIISSNVWAENDCFPEDVLPENMFPVLEFVTSKGTIVVELNRNRAPATVNNFLRYVLDGHYNETIFHRVIADFVVQGGGYTAEFEERPVHEPVLNESGNGLANRSGSIAMARYNDPHSATSQFFFNMENNESLNPNSRSWGYKVFGDVIGGFEVLEKIAAVETGYSESLDAPDVPVEPVMLVEVKLQP
ncbi:MAG: peptidyl-prolyl cis-trans isomerase [Desulfofustis sp.]|nr:peptidyl-prolyl cis-trans isomerase [Desulfofustis sp.]